jgi:diguanylate cyclase (GGDEF)-like protein
MSLDVPTLMLVGAFVALLSGALLIFAWQQYREMSAVLWWAASNVFLSFGVALLAFGGVWAEDGLLAVGFVCLTLSPALLWTSARLLNGLKAGTVSVLLGPAAVAAINLLPAQFPVPEIRGAASTLLNVSYLLAAAWTLVMRSRERLVSRWPLAALILLHTAVLLTGPIAAARSGGAVDMPAVNSLFGMIHFEALLVIIGTTIFVVASMRESSELRHKQAAETDSLTGLPNRRDFLDKGTRLLERARSDSGVLAVAAIDLDRFKAVNDNFGHAIGDQALRLFADVARKTLRPNDLVGRLGGEEFAVILPGSDLAAALAMAERLRRAFAEAATIVDGRELNATFSAGIAGTEGRPELTLSDLLQRADTALYNAKRNGRDRVETCDDGRPAKAAQRIVRIA